jgi:hypothetical protein
MENKQVPAWQWVLAGCGVATLAGAAALGIMHWSGAGQATQGPTPLTLHPERQEAIAAQRRAEGLAERLDLDPAQTERIAGILAHFRAERLADREANRGNFMGLAQARRSAIQQLDSELQAVLTEAQRAKYTEARADLMGRVMDLRALRPALAPGLPERPPLPFTLDATNPTEPPAP